VGYSEREVLPSPEALTLSHLTMYQRKRQGAGGRR
jgi:hypothetical protein